MKRNPVKYNYTDTFRAALELAAEHAKELRCGEITNDLLLWGVLTRRHQCRYPLPDGS